MIRLYKLGRLQVFGVVTTLLALSACEDAPFSEGPPPTFAIVFKIESLYGFPDTAMTLVGHWLFNVNGPYFTSGATTSFGPASALVGHYYTVNDGRWPARWGVGAVAGLCTGQYQEINIVSKLITASCEPQQGSMDLEPTYWEDPFYPPGSMTATFYDEHFLIQEWA